jgi:iron complex outermembrane receptor protein
VTAGGEYVHNFRLDQFVTDQGSRTLDLRQPNRRWAVYAQDEIRIAAAVLANLGVRHDQYGSFGGHTSPRLGLIVNPAGATTVKALFGTAFRAPNVYELHYFQEAELRPETIRTGELIVERVLGRGLHGSVSGFWNDIDGLITLDTDVHGELFFRNVGRIRSRGVEASLEAARGGTLARATYSFQHTTDRATGLELSNSPRHLAKASLSVPFAARFTAATDAQYTSSRRTLRGRTAAGAFLVDLHLAARSLSSRLELGVAVRNAFDAEYATPGSEEHLQDLLLQDGRSFGLTLTWRF